MRQPQNAKRGRGRGRRGNGNNHQHQAPNRNTSYESNGPDVKLRGNAQQLHEKYMTLAHDAASSGERISAEAYPQFADHYFRLHQAAVGNAETKRNQDQGLVIDTPQSESNPLPVEAVSDEAQQATNDAGGPDVIGSDSVKASDEGKSSRRRNRTNGNSSTSTDDANESAPSSTEAMSPAQIAKAIQNKAAAS